jgi:hypothetical protein
VVKLVPLIVTVFPPVVGPASGTTLVTLGSASAPLAKEAAVIPPAPSATASAATTSDVQRADTSPLPPPHVRRLPAPDPIPLTSRAAPRLARV